MCCCPWALKELDTAEQLDNNSNNIAEPRVESDRDKDSSGNPFSTDHCDNSNNNN